MSFKKFEGLISRMTKDLAKLYLAKEDARAVAGRAGLDIQDIPFSDRSIDTWNNILIHAMNHSSLLPLIETCLKEYPNSSVLLEAVSSFYQQEKEGEPEAPATMNEREILEELLDVLDLSYAGFRSQIENRNNLNDRIRSRLKIEENLPYEDVFAAYFDEMNRFEKRLHKNIRAATEYIRDKNARSLELVIQLKVLNAKIPKLVPLRKHLDLWLHKYDNLFVKDPAMCILYTGVTEKLPFPKGVEDEIRAYLKSITSV